MSWTTFGCDGKKQYRERRHAKRDASVLSEKDGDNVSAYLCPKCWYWHVGHATLSRNGRTGNAYKRQKRRLDYDEDEY